MKLEIAAKVIITPTVDMFSEEDKKLLLLQAEIAINSLGTFDSDFGLAGIRINFYNR